MHAVSSYPPGRHMTDDHTSLRPPFSSSDTNRPAVTLSDMPVSYVRAKKGKNEMGIVFFNWFLFAFLKIGITVAVMGHGLL